MTPVPFLSLLVQPLSITYAPSGIKCQVAHDKDSHQFLILFDEAQLLDYVSHSSDQRAEFLATLDKIILSFTSKITGDVTDGSENRPQYQNDNSCPNLECCPSCSCKSRSNNVTDKFED